MSITAGSTDFCNSAFYQSVRYSNQTVWTPTIYCSIQIEERNEHTTRQKYVMIPMKRFKCK